MKSKGWSISASRKFADGYPREWNLSGTFRDLAKNPGFREGVTIIMI
jgi:hypothetical protein